MALGLDLDGPADGARDRGVGSARAQGRAQVHLVVAEEAEAQMSARGEADAVATVTKVVRERRDEADAPRRARVAEVGRGAVPRRRSLGDQGFDRGKALVDLV